MDSSLFRPSGSGRSWLAAAALAGVAALGVGGAVAFAAGPDEGGVIHGCYEESTGALRVIDTGAGETCAESEQSLSWNQTGPRGPQGEPGADGGSAADFQTFAVTMSDGDEVVLASNGPLRYVARCLFRVPPYGDFNADGWRYTQLQDVNRVAVFVTSEVDGFTSARMRDPQTGEDSVALPAGAERQILMTEIDSNWAASGRDIRGGNVSYAVTAGKTHKLRLDGGVLFGIDQSRHVRTCTVVGTAVATTGPAPGS